MRFGWFVLLGIVACGGEDDVTCSCSCECEDASQAVAEATCVADDEPTCCDEGCDAACQDQGSGPAASSQAECEAATTTSG